jgi:membrane-associated protease RseP (regulator of RpoE activity)
MTISFTDAIALTQPVDPYTSSVEKVFRIEDVTWGDDKQNFLVRYRGHLIIDSALAYEQLTASLHPLDITPLFREESGAQSIMLVKGVVRPRPSNPWINLILFILTVFSVLISGTVTHYSGPLSTDLGVISPHLMKALADGLMFTVSLLAILLAHEFGHYLVGRYHHSAVTLPYFIPFPLSPFGTMGAFIQLKEPPKNKRILLDIGIAGPLAGLFVAIPVLLLGLALSRVDQLPTVLSPGQSFSLEGNSILYLFLKFIVFGRVLPEPQTFQGLSPLVYWFKYFFTGRPVPFGGVDVLLHPIAWAGWAGLLITALNLIPAGQLDGGHVLFVLIGQKARAVLPFILVILLVLGTVWSGWWLWAFLIFFLGRVFAEPRDQITPLDGKRKAIAILGLLVFILVFMPVPLNLFSS